MAKTVYPQSFPFRTMTVGDLMKKLVDTGGRGTENMIGIAAAAGIPVWKPVTGDLA